MHRAYFGENASPDRFLNAVYSIIEANVQMDHQEGLKDEPELHFDEETFWDAQKILRLRNNQINTVTGDGKYSIARNLLGRNIHSIQKFYAHSNWVELGNDKTVDLISGEIANVAGNTTNTCDENAEFVTELLTSGYYVKFVQFLFHQSTETFFFI